MSANELQRFAQALVQHVRDRAIVECDRLAGGNVKGLGADRWRDAIRDDNAVVTLIPDIVDQTLFELLDAVDNGLLPLGWQQQSGELVPLDELGQGELAGWLVGSPGWRHAHATQRYSDDLADLRLDDRTPSTTDDIREH